MEKLIEQHLKDVTVDALRQFREESFSRYASSGNCQLGVSGSGMYIVKVGDQTLKFQSPQAAVEHYSYHVRGCVI